jgi:hypothetical protein
LNESHLIACFSFVSGVHLRLAWPKAKGRQVPEAQLERYYVFYWDGRRLDDVKSLHPQHLSFQVH